MKGDSIFDLSGKAAIVTGGGRGLGRTMALALADVGANVVISDIIINQAEYVAKEIIKKNIRSLAIKVDVTKPKEVQRMVSQVMKHFRRIDILVNNAGINIIAPAESFGLKDWDKVLSINLKGVFLCAQAVGKVMIKQRKGKIINIASIAGMVGTPHHAVAYNSSKAGVINLTRALAIEWGKYNINVNAIAPGIIETDLTRKRLENKKYYKYWTDRTPLGRIGKPEDLIGALIYLSSETSDWLTGHTIVVDGGYTAL
jgi:NAD(P)-dependent dehydrogenase (short-subunit alcohol dehydrogenase family)